MSTVLELPDEAIDSLSQDDLNLAVWDILIEDPYFATVPYRIETDKHGQIIMSPPPSPSHGKKQIGIGALILKLLPQGETISECPISTSEGVKAADIAWCSKEKWDQTETQSCFLTAPEICVEIISPSNTRNEIAEKKTLYFGEGAEEVWLVAKSGEISFYLKEQPDADAEKSDICPDFPASI